MGQIQRCTLDDLCERVHRFSGGNRGPTLPSESLENETLKVMGKGMGLGVQLLQTFLP